MKCPKCGYIGFESAQKCRNCGYDFSLVNDPLQDLDLPLKDDDRPIAPADFDFVPTNTPPVVAGQRRAATAGDFDLPNLTPSAVKADLPLFTGPASAQAQPPAKPAPPVPAAAAPAAPPAASKPPVPPAPAAAQTSSAQAPKPGAPASAPSSAAPGLPKLAPSYATPAASATAPAPPPPPEPAPAPRSVAPSPAPAPASSGAPALPKLAPPAAAPVPSAPAPGLPKLAPSYSTASTSASVPAPPPRPARAPSIGPSPQSAAAPRDAAAPGPVVRPGAPEVAPRSTLPLRRPVTPPTRVRPLDFQEGELALEPEPERARPSGRAASAGVGRPAGSLARAVAAAIDVLILMGLDAGVVYFTLRICRLSFGDATILPMAPLVAFFLLLDGGYLVAFTAFGGQTIGKMAASLKVVADDGGRVPPGSAVVRAAGYLASLLPAGLGFVPAFFGPSRRSLHDRLANTRVVCT